MFIMFGILPGIQPIITYSVISICLGIFIVRNAHTGSIFLPYLRKLGNLCTAPEPEATITSLGSFYQNCQQLK